MAQLKRSLLLKLILAFWAVSLLGIVFMALLAGRVSQLEFTRFIRESRYQGLTDKLSAYYAQKGNFSGADYLLEEAKAAQTNDAREFLVVDTQGNILLSLTQHIPPPSPDFVRFGYPIESNKTVVAYLLPMRPPRSPAENAVDNMKRLNQNLFIGLLAALLVALVFGWFVARTIIRPLRNLNEITRSIAQGDLEKTVSINSNDEIGTLANSFNQMIGSLRRSRDLRRQMTADIAHELRNPLSIIMGNAEALSEGVLPATPQTLDIIYDEAKHLSRLVDDLRTLSLSESGELHLQRSQATPGELLERCVTAYAIRAREHELTLRTEVADGLPQVDVDVERIQQVLANLVDNALKHTPQGGSIQLSAALLSNGVVELSVEDSGSGIAPEDLPFIFERFYRGVHKSGRILDGSGLGLAISRALVELHGGRITASSQVGKGTRIGIQLT